MIGFCIPSIGIGARYLSFYLDNLFSTAQKPDEIKVFISYHDQSDLVKLKDCLDRVHKAVEVPKYKQGYFTPSSNHSAAINALAHVVEGDHVIFSDYDMAFLKKGWDETIKGRLEEKDIFGVPYPPYLFKATVDGLGEAMKFIKDLHCAKYQGCPNLSFMAMKMETLKRLGYLTTFDDFLSSGGIPFRLINHPDLIHETGLPMGSIQWLDTGWEIPGKCVELGLKPEPLEYSSVFGGPNAWREPETYGYQGNPFLAHFRKGSSKAKHREYDDSFDGFKRLVNEHLHKAG